MGSDDRLFEGDRTRRRRSTQTRCPISSSAARHCASSGNELSSISRSMFLLFCAWENFNLHPTHPTVHPNKSTGGSTHKGSTKDLPHSGRSSRSRRFPCPYKFLGSTPHHVVGSQATPNQSRRHHSPKGNRRCVEDELLDLVLQMIVSPTLNSFSQIWIWWKKNWSGKHLGEG